MTEFHTCVCNEGVEARELRTDSLPECENRLIVEEIYLPHFYIDLPLAVQLFCNLRFRMLALFRVPTSNNYSRYVELDSAPDLLARQLSFNLYGAGAHIQVFDDLETNTDIRSSDHDRLSRQVLLG